MGLSGYRRWYWRKPHLVRAGVRTLVLSQVRAVACELTPSGEVELYFDLERARRQRAATHLRKQILRAF